MANLELIKKALHRYMPVLDHLFEEFAQMFEMVRLEKGQLWERAGKVPTYLAFVNKGVFRQYLEMDGEAFIEQFFAQGQFMGNYLGYQEQKGSRYHVQALTSCELLALRFEKMQCMIELSKQMQQFSNHYQNEKFSTIDGLYSRLLTNSAEQRYKWLVTNRPELLKQIPQYYIAQYLGVKPETLSRIKKRVA